MQGLLFDRAPPFVNLSRVDPELLCSVDARISFLDTKKTAACIMIGFATSSEISGCTEQTNRMQKHQVTVAPFSQFHRREVAVWGKILGFTSISGSVVDAGMSFSTRQEQTNASVPSSPGKRVYLHTIRSKPFPQ